MTTKLEQQIDPIVERAMALTPEFIRSLGDELEPEERMFHARRAMLRAIGSMQAERGAAAMIGGSGDPFDEEKALDVRAELTEDETLVQVMLGISAIFPNGTREWYCLSCLAEYPEAFEPDRCPHCGHGLFRPTGETF